MPEFDDVWQEKIWYWMNDAVKEKKEQDLIDKPYEEDMQKWIDEMERASRRMSEL